MLNKAQHFHSTLTYIMNQHEAAILKIYIQDVYKMLFSPHLSKVSLLGNGLHNEVLIYNQEMKDEALISESS